MMLYDLLTSTPEMLDQMCTHADTKALVQALTDMGPKGQYLDEIKKVLGRRGDPSQVMPIYIASLKAKRGMSGRDSSDPATLKAVSLSKSPEAVQFMIDALDDITAPDDWRHEAFIHLPGTGGEAGIRAVQRARHKPGPRPTWQESLTKRINRTDLITQGTDAKGRSWRLVESGIFGNSSDLFIQEQKGTKWGDAVFLNIYTGRTFGGEIPNNYKGIPMTKLIETEWLNVFTDDPSIRIDSDADGLTDLVEERLGTDPKTADMDGDGLKDSVDPCPNAAPRVLNDKEKIIAACVEAKFFAQSWEVPAIVSVKDIKPFEMLGLDCFLLWQSDGKNNSLGKMYGAGMNRIGFSPPMKNFEDSTEGKDVIQISPDGKSAETLISRYSGGLNGEGEVVKLIKRGDEWFVIAIEMRFVS